MLILSILVSLTLSAVGFLMMAGGMMSDAPIEGQQSANAGGILLLIGIAGLAASLVAHFAFHLI